MAAVYQRNPKRLYAAALLVFVSLAGLVGCAPREDGPVAEDASESQAPAAPLGLEGTPRALASLPRERWQVDREWRDGHVLRPGNHRVDLGRAAAGDALCAGVHAVPGARAVLTLYHGDTALLTRDAGDPCSEEAESGWLDLRVPVPPGHEAAACTLMLASGGAVHLGPLEIVRPKAGPPNIYVFLIDTLRQDFLGCYGHPGDVSPAMDAFAKDAVRFRNLMPTSSWTRPSVASLFTGTWANTHGAYSEDTSILPDTPSLAGSLQELGYMTQCFATNPNCIPECGFDTGMNRFVEIDALTKNPGPDQDRRAVAAAIQAARQLAGRPAYLYIHTMAPHAPYAPPKAFLDRSLPERFAGTRQQVRVQKDVARYTGEVAFIDALFGEFVQSLREAGLYEDSLIVLLSDHGEQFMEHGEMAHAHSLHREEVRVPLLVKLPGNPGAGASRNALVQMADIAPTLLSLVGAPVPEGMEGTAFTSLFQYDNLVRNPYVFASLFRPDRGQFMAREYDTKYIYDAKRGIARWFDTVEDPWEHDPLPRWPGLEGRSLQYWAHHRAVSGAPGLHVLMALPKAGAARLYIDVVAEDIAGAWQAWEDCEAQIEHGAGRIRLRMDPSPETPAYRPPERDGPPRPKAEMVLRLPADTSVSLSVGGPGGLALAGLAMTGPDGEALPGTFAPGSLRGHAPPEKADTSAAPCLRAWYIPESLEGTAADVPAMKGALEALGYL